MPTGIRMTKRNKLRIVKRARKILSHPYNWTSGMLRKGSSYDEGGYRYCVLGACERAAYDLGLAVANSLAAVFIRTSVDT